MASGVCVRRCRTVTPACVLVRVPEDGSWRQRAPTVQNKLSDVRVRRCRTTHASARPGSRARRRFVVPARAHHSEQAQQRPRAPLLRNPRTRILVCVPEDGLWHQRMPAVQRKLGSIRGCRCSKTHARQKTVCGVSARRPFRGRSVASAPATAAQPMPARVLGRARRRFVVPASQPFRTRSAPPACILVRASEVGSLRQRAPAVQDMPSGVRAPLRHTHARKLASDIYKTVSGVRVHRGRMFTLVRAMAQLGNKGAPVHAAEVCCTNAQVEQYWRRYNPRGWRMVAGHSLFTPLTNLGVGPVEEEADIWFDIDRRLKPWGPDFRSGARVLNRPERATMVLQSTGSRIKLSRIKMCLCDNRHGSQGRWPVVGVFGAGSISPVNCGLKHKVGSAVSDVSEAPPLCAVETSRATSPA
ncbi:hypothetical protein DFH09DRAFT_1104920 [Mycena vulgaris]|nr:hypothetical protein DFH09DRAFT_1104920 [Mycena vulgaris]